MADNLNMNGLSLQDSQLAGSHGFQAGARQAYVPPHVRQNGPPSGRPMGGMDGSAWGPQA